MDIRISPSKLGNRYVLGRAERDIRNITGSFRIDKFAQGIISKYEKSEATDLPFTEMEILKRPELPEALADIREIINELLFINRSHTDIENSIFRSISIENNILRINMLLSKLEASNQYKEIKQGLEEIYHIQMAQPAGEEIKEGTQLELPLGTVTEKELIAQIETVLHEGGIHSNELVERIMGPAEKTISSQREELIRQPEYIPTSTTILSQWKSPEAKSFFWRVQRLEKQDRELVLRSLGNISLSRLETVLSEMDSRTWNQYSSFIAERIKLNMAEPQTEDIESRSLMAEPIAAEKYYSQLLEIIGNEKDITPEALLEEKEGLLRFLEKDDADTERIREEVINILGGVKAIRDIEAMDTAAFATMYDKIRKRAEDMPGELAEQLLPILREEGAEITKEQIEIARQNVLTVLRQSQMQREDRSEAFIRDILRESEHHTRNYQRASEIAEATMNLNATEWQRFTIELRKLSEKSELSRRYLKAREEAIRAGQTAKSEDGDIDGAENTKQLSPEMRARVDSTREKMIFITQLDKAFKEGIDIYQEGELLTENSVFSQYVYKRNYTGENIEIPSTRIQEIRTLVAGLTTENLQTLTDTIYQRIREREEREIRIRGELPTESSEFSQYVHRKNHTGESSEIPPTRIQEIRTMVEGITTENLRTLTDTNNQRIREREERETRIRGDILETLKEEKHHFSQLETLLEERELIYPELRMRMIRSSMEPMLEEMVSENPSRFAVDQAINYLEKRRDERTGETVVREEILSSAPVELVTMRREAPASREEIEAIKKTADDTRRQIDRNTTDIQFLKGDTELTEITNERIVDVKSLQEKLTVQENEIEKIKEIQEQMIRAGKSDSYYTQKTITKVNEQLRMERLRRGL